MLKTLRELVLWLGEDAGEEGSAEPSKLAAPLKELHEFQIEFDKSYVKVAYV